MTNPACWHLLTSLLAEVFGGLWVLCPQPGTPVVLQNCTTIFPSKNCRNYGSRIWHDEDVQSFVHTLDIINSHGTTRYHFLMITHQQARKIGCFELWNTAPWPSSPAADSTCPPGHQLPIHCCCLKLILGNSRVCSGWCQRLSYGCVIFTGSLHALNHERARIAKLAKAWSQKTNCWPSLVSQNDCSKTLTELLTIVAVKTWCFATSQTSLKHLKFNAMILR